MPELGPFVVYSDPRLYGLIEHYHLGPFQRSLLLGQRSWDSTDWNGLSEVECEHAPASIVVSLGREGFEFRLAHGGIMHISVDLPPPDLMSPILIEQWNLTHAHIPILALEGPIDTIGEVPIFKAIVFGNTERSDGCRRSGFNKDAWIVGRQDVREVIRCYDGVSPWAMEYGPIVVRKQAIRGSLRRARNIARRVADALPEWDRYVAWRADRVADAERARLDAEFQAAVDADAGVDAFRA